ncbi:MAG: radical SAM protein [Oscillospiraceae bacterium]|nr:radical SAM protein [Oscillospiraceae bacterium]
MEQSFNLQDHIVQGVEKIVSEVLKATAKDPCESAFMLKFAAASRRASRLRRKLEEEGTHMPSFLIASVTSRCNLHCAGCYSRCSDATVDAEPVRQLTGEEWLSIFHEAEGLGVSFILLAGGEPMLRWDVISAAATVPDILFPIFTNGTFLGDNYLTLLDAHRNLVPVLSIEGGREITDRRRGEGVYDRLIAVMDALCARHLLFGASVTVTTENLREVTSPAFLDTLARRGCKLVIYVEFVPVTEEARSLAPGEAERAALEKAMGSLRSTYPELLLLSFPGDEKSTDGCMAAGRGFFHINSHGGAEPCPFSPYSDINVRDTSLRQAVESKLFHALRDGDFLDDEHVGGCVLYEKRGKVEALLAKGMSSESGKTPPAAPLYKRQNSRMDLLTSTIFS